MTEVAKEYGYGDGTGVHQVITRLQAKAKNDRALSDHPAAHAKNASRIDPISVSSLLIS